MKDCEILWIWWHRKKNITHQGRWCHTHCPLLWNAAIATHLGFHGTRSLQLPSSASVKNALSCFCAPNSCLYTSPSTRKLSLSAPVASPHKRGDNNQTKELLAFPTTAAPFFLSALPRERWNLTAALLSFVGPPHTRRWRSLVLNVERVSKNLIYFALSCVAGQRGQDWREPTIRILNSDWPK